jgi:hypothetical protein
LHGDFFAMDFGFANSLMHAPARNHPYFSPPNWWQSTTVVGEDRSTGKV